MIATRDPADPASRPSPRTGPSRGRAARRLGARGLRIVVVDESDVVHAGFRSLLGDQPWVECLAFAHDAASAVEAAVRHDPHVAVVDASIGGERGMDICARLRAASPRTRCLLISNGVAVSPAEARAAGVSGVVPKRLRASGLVAAVRFVGLGRTLLKRARGPDCVLTARERDVLRWLAAGAKNREIAEALSLSTHTVKDHTRALYRKIGARNRTQAAMRGAELGLLRTGRAAGGVG